MLVDDSVSAVQSMLRTMSPVPSPVEIIHLLKAATTEFALHTAVTIVTTDITPTGAVTYAIDDSRVGRIYKVDHVIDATTIYDARIFDSEFFKGHAQKTSTSGGYMTEGGVFRPTPNLLRVWPAVNTGTLRLHHAPIPVPVNRGSLTPGAESVTAATTSSVTVASLSQGKVSNFSANSSYYNGCFIEFTTGALVGYRVKITNYNEAAGAHVLTYTPTTAAAGIGDKFTIRDVLEISDYYAHDCVAYAVGILGSADNVLKGSLGPMMLRRYEMNLEMAKSRKYAVEPGTQPLVVQRDDSDYMSGFQDSVGYGY